MDGNEWTLAAPTSVVQPPCDELFAGARFSDDEHGGPRGSDSLDARKDLAHARRAAHHALEDRGPRWQVVFVAGLPYVVGAQKLLQQRDEAHRIDRLLQII